MASMEPSADGVEVLRSPRRVSPTQSLFFARASASPRATAIICDDHLRSYGEIAGRAHSLSNRLAAVGVARGKAVALVMDSGWERVVAELGILEAGAGYLTVDPSWPDSLRERVLRDENADLIVTQPWLETRLAAGERRRIVTIAEDASLEAQRLAPLGRSGAHDLVCVCCGAGADGSAVEYRFDQRAAMAQLSDVNERHQVDSSDSLLDMSAIDATVSPYDPLGPLAVGGAIVVPTRSEIARPTQWLDLIEDYEPTIWSSTADRLRTLLSSAHDRASALVSLRLVVVTGRAIPIDLARAVRHLVPQARLAALRPSACATTTIRAT
jgi:non-ribosomal peptide synthetase component F